MLDNVPETKNIKFNSQRIKKNTNECLFAYWLYHAFTTLLACKLALFLILSSSTNSLRMCIHIFLILISLLRFQTYIFIAYVFFCLVYIYMYVWSLLFWQIRAPSIIKPIPVHISQRLKNYLCKHKYKHKMIVTWNYENSKFDRVTSFTKKKKKLQMVVCFLVQLSK